MTARFVKNGLPTGAKLLSAGVAALTILLGEMAIASASPQLKTYPIVAIDAEKATSTDRIATTGYSV